MPILGRFTIYDFVYTIFIVSVFAADNEIKNTHWFRSALFPRAPSTIYESTKHEYENTVDLEKSSSPKFSQPIKNSHGVIHHSRVMADKIASPMSNDIFPNSKIYYFRMPVPAPFIYLADFDQFDDRVRSPSFTPYNVESPSFPVHLPLPFTSNGKPFHVYKFPQNDLNPATTTSKPKVTSTRKPPYLNLLNLNKGPYPFNGKPADIYLLQDSLNSLFSNSLGNFYP